MNSPEQMIQNDHDLLIELRTEVRAIREDIKGVSNSLSARVNDHETRIRTVEKETDNLMGKMVFGISIISFLMAIIVGVIIQWIKKLAGL